MFKRRHWIFQIEPLVDWIIDNWSHGQKATLLERTIYKMWSARIRTQWRYVFKSIFIIMKLLNENGMFNHREEIEDFSKRVEKQYSLEKKMNEMVDNLKEIKLGITKYKTTYVL